MIHLLGVDGIGKTTMLFELENLAYSVLRCPQYHLSSQANIKIEKKYRMVSSYLELVSQWCDQNSQNELKAWSLFYAMSLYNKIVTGAPGFYQWSERYPAFDVKIYGPIYLKLLKVMIENQNTEFTDNINAQLNSAQLPFPKELHEYLEEVTGTSDFFNSFKFIYQTLAGDNSVKMEELFPHFPSHKFVLFYATEETIQDRLKLKMQGQKLEYHESGKQLIQIQNAYENLAKRFNNLSVCRISVDNLSRQDLLQAVIQSTKTGNSPQVTL